jgi:hypothetical protein
MRSLPPMRSPQLMCSLPPMRSLPLIPRLHPTLRLAPRALPRKKPLEVKNSLVSSESTATHCARPLDLKGRGIRKSINSQNGVGSLRGPAPFPFWRYAAIEVMSALPRGAVPLCHRPPRTQLRRLRHNSSHTEQF